NLAKEGEHFMYTNYRTKQMSGSRQRSKSLASLMFGLPYVVGLVACVSLTSHAQVLPANTHDDTQQWNDIQIAVPVTKQVDFNFYSTFRIGRDISHLVDRRVGAGFSFKVGKYLTLTPSYLNIVMRPFERVKVN